MTTTVGPEGVPHPARSARWGPWQAEPSKKETSRRLNVLLLHGFAGTPREMLPLGQTLLRRGFSVRAPLLPGHGENLQAMREVCLEDWLEAVVQTYTFMQRDERPIAILGFCLGGALALHLAGQLYPRAIGCLATPAQPLPTSMFPSADGLCSNLKNISDGSSSEVRRWRQAGCHLAVPDSFFAQYQQLLSKLSSTLADVRCPLLVAQSRDDGITPPQDAELILKAAQSSRRKLVWSQRSGHALPIDVGRRALFQEIVSFLEEEDQAAAYTCPQT